jgi:endonuclease III related protein
LKQLNKSTKSNPLEIYNKLFDYYGAQYWWPAQSPFEVIIGAILTQNTNWFNVEKALLNLKKEGLLDAQRLYLIQQKRLAELIRPAGYYNIKAKRIKNFLTLYIKKYHGRIEELRKVNLEILRKELLAVNGIGPETADSILLYALNKPIFVVDAYTKRIFFRHKLIRKEDEDYHFVQNICM